MSQTAYEPSFTPLTFTQSCADAAMEPTKVCLTSGSGGTTSVNESGDLVSEARGTIAATTAANNVLAARPTRVSYMVQNTGNTILFAKRGTAATGSDYTYIMPGGAVALDGLGGNFFDGEWTGAVSLYNAGAGPGNYTVSEVYTA